MAHILLICNVNDDRVVQLDRPIAAGARLDGRFVERRIGGAGANAGSALVASGHRVSIATTLGGDANGDWLAAEAARLGLDLRWLERYPQATPTVYILLQPDGERSILFLDRRPPYRPPDEVLRPPPDCLFVNSACDAVAELMAASLARSLVVAQMPQRLITRWPAHIMLASASDLTTEMQNDPYAAGRAMAGEALRWVVVTRGADGACAYGPAQSLQVPAFPATVVDTTGAGDIFAAGVAHTLLAGLDMQQALTTGARWAAFAVASSESVAAAGLRAHLARAPAK